MNHYFDRLGICLKCDLCNNSECCPNTSEECDNKSWEFINRLPEYIKEFKKVKNESVKL